MQNEWEKKRNNKSMVSGQSWAQRYPCLTGDSSQQLIAPHPPTPWDGQFSLPSPTMGLGNSL